MVEGYILDAFIKVRSPNNPFTKLRNAEFYSCAFDATTEYVTSVNATFTRSVCDDGSVTVIPYELLKLSGSFTGEALYVVLADVVGKIGEVENSAFECINSFLDMEVGLQPIPPLNFCLYWPLYLKNGHSAKMVMDKLFIDNSKDFRLVCGFLL